MSVKIAIISPKGAMRDALAQYLRSLGFEITFSDGDVSDSRVAILTTDLVETSAYTICQSLRERDANLPIVILSNEITLGEDVKARYVGASAVFKLPFEPKQLTDFLKKVTSNG